MFICLITMMVTYAFKLQHEGWWFVSVPHGKEIGEFEGIKAFSHNSRIRGTYGMEFQCVEFVNRFYATKLGHRNMTMTGHADSYFFQAQDKGLVPYPNGGQEPPQKYDILIFDGGPKDGNPGHVGIISRVNLAKGEVEIIQQNVRVLRSYGLFQKPVPIATHSLVKQKGGSWFIQSGTTVNLPVVGWSRRPTTKENL